MNEVLVGIVEGIIYRNEENGYSVLEIGGSDGCNFVAVGVMPLPEKGEKVQLSGVWTEHKTYGEQFKVNTYNIIQPTELEDIAAYLANGNIKGVGKAVAGQIVEKFGEDTFNILDNNPMRLLEIPGIGNKKMQDIITSYNQQKANRGVMIEMQKLDITQAQAAKIYKTYGDGCINIIKSNPYKLIEDIENIGFKIADKIARNTGIAYNSPMRISAGIRFIMDWARQEGHTYLPYDVLITATSTTIGVERDEVEPELEKLLMLKKLVQNTLNEQKIVFIPQMRKMELDIAASIVEQNRAYKKPMYFDVKEEIRRIAEKNGITLAEKQNDALNAMFTKGVVVITGGPGTGKTTILKIAIELMKSFGMTFELAAPTGRAAKRMAVATGNEAQTIHRLLEYSFTEQIFLRDENDPLDADFLIIDEMSMVDVTLMNAVMKAVTSDTRLILVGDADQLPSVGAGNVLRDILDSGKLYSVKLTEVYRQAACSMIISNAHRINNGVSPNLDDLDSDFNFYEMYDLNLILNEVVNVCSGKAENVLRTKNIWSDVQVLAPMKKGILGVHNLNNCLQKAMNPADISKCEIQYGEAIFREGDKVMQIKNNYSIEWTRSDRNRLIEEGKGIFNGDIGTITNVDKRNNTLEVKFESGALAEYTHDMLQELNLAYCISIHKSQGSEFNTVIMPIAGGATSFLTRNLLYTAVTRAKNQVCIFGRRDTINSMVVNKSTKRRYTALRYMIEEYVCVKFPNN